MYSNSYPNSRNNNKTILFLWNEEIFKLLYCRILINLAHHCEYMMSKLYIHWILNTFFQWRLSIVNFRFCDSVFSICTYLSQHHLKCNAQLLKYFLCISYDACYENCAHHTVGAGMFGVASWHSKIDGGYDSGHYIADQFIVTEDTIAQTRTFSSCFVCTALFV